MTSRRSTHTHVAARVNTVRQSRAAHEDTQYNIFEAYVAHAGELYEVCSVIEAYSKHAALQGRSRVQATACGWAFSNNEAPAPTTVRVTDRNTVRTMYTLDRWE